VHPHNVARNMFVDVAGASQPAPAPRFSRTTTSVQGAPAKPGAHTHSALLEWGFDEQEIHALTANGAIA
jgi:alpha-methylacyl-CoA racemase